MSDEPQLTDRRADMLVLAMARMLSALDYRGMVDRWPELSRAQSYAEADRLVEGSRAEVVEAFRAMMEL